VVDAEKLKKTQEALRVARGQFRALDSQLVFDLAHCNNPKVRRGLNRARIHLEAYVRPVDDLLKELEDG
jgi:hypothetical protein